MLIPGLSFYSISVCKKMQGGGISLVCGCVPILTVNKTFLLFQADSDVALSQWVSMIEDTLRHQLQPSQFSISESKLSSTQYSYQPYSSHLTATAGISAGSTDDVRQGFKDSSAFDHSQGTPAATTSGDTREDTSVRSDVRSSGASNSTSNRKITLYTRNRSPTGTSPATKSRKASTGKHFLAAQSKRLMSRVDIPHSLSA